MSLLSKFKRSDDTSATDAEQEQQALHFADETMVTDEEGFESLLALKNLEKSRAKKKRAKRIKMATGAALALLVGFGGFFGYNALNASDPSAGLASRVATVTREDYENVVSTSGTLKAGATVIVAPEVNGTIEQVLVSEGQAVEKDQVLFVIKNEELDQAVRDAKLDLESANNSAYQAQLGVDSARAAYQETWDAYNQQYAEARKRHREWEAVRNNYNANHAAWLAQKQQVDALACNAPVDPGSEPEDPPKVDDPGPDASDEEKAAYQEYLTKKARHDEWSVSFDAFHKDLENYRAYQDALAQLGEEPPAAGEEPSYPIEPQEASLLTAIESAEASVTSAANGVAKAQAALDDAVKNAEKRNVKAPISGNVVSLGAAVGEVVAGGTLASSPDASKSPLVQISDVKQMSIDAEVNQIEILGLEKGMEADVTFSALPDVTCKAIISEIATVATKGENVVTYHVGLTIPHPDEQLREGMTGNVKIATTRVPDALVVPSAALTDLGDGIYTVNLLTDESSYETETKRVVVGAHNSVESVITEGLNEGDKLLMGEVEDDESGA